MDRLTKNRLAMASTNGLGSGKRLKLNLPILPWLVIVLLVLQLIAPFDGWMILLAGLGGAWLVSYLWVRILSNHLHIDRLMRFGWTQVGDRLEERFTLINETWLPGVWVEVVDYTTLPNYNTSRVTGVEGMGTNQWHTEGLCTQRGLFRLGPTSLRSGDPLGIYTLELHNPTARALMVTPPIMPLPGIEIARGGQSGEGRPRPNAPERTVSAAGVREYLAGESLRFIHWRTSAHRDELFVRLFEGTPAADWWIILDLNQNAQVGQGQSSTEEHAVILAASLADRGLKMRQAVGLAANGNDLAWLPPQRNDSQRWGILRALALVKRGERSLADLLRRMRPSFGKQASLILITPDVEGSWVKELIPLLWAGSVPTVLLLDPVSFGGTGQVRKLMDVLADLGIQRYTITRELLDRPEARPGQTGHWEWRVSPRGRAIAVQRPVDQEWKKLA